MSRGTPESRAGERRDERQAQGLDLGSGNEEEVTQSQGC